jgi:phosphoglycolate phosphatase
MIATAGTAITPRLVLFDLDGTLVDSVRDLARAADDMLADLGLAAVSEERVRAYVGNGIERLVHRCLTADMQRDADTHLFTRALRRFQERYEQHNGRHSMLFDGVLQGLDAAAAFGADLGCVTNKPARFTEPLLERFGIRSRFSVVVSGDTTAHKKPHPQPLLFAARTRGVCASDTLVVGDSANDVRAARAAGMRVVCVSYGYNHGLDIADSNPDAVLANLGALSTVLAAAAPLARNRLHPS